MNRDDFKKSQERNQRYIQHLQKQLKLENTEAFYYSLVENIPQYIFCKDLDGNFTFVNQLFCNLLEKPIEEVIGKNDHDFFPEELASKYRQDDLRVIEENRTFEDIEENKISHRESKFVHVVKTPIHDADGKIIGIQGIFWDITSRIKAEQELKNANEKMKQDLVAAAKVQRGFIPEKAPKIPGFRFAWVFEPSEYVGGDLLNVLRLDDRHWAFYVLDVSGHGIPAALLSVSITRMIDQVSIASDTLLDDAQSAGRERGFFNPEKMVNLLRRRFPGDSTKFCTLLYAILDTESHTVSWVRAGHVPPLVVRRSDEQTTYFHHPEGVGISRISTNEFELPIGTVKLEPGDRFVVFSDGIVEAMRGEQEFGYERLAGAMSKTIAEPLEDALRMIYRGAALWSGGAGFDDDVTLLALERAK